MEQPYQAKSDDAPSQDHVAEAIKHLKQIGNTPPIAVIIQAIEALSTEHDEKPPRNFNEAAGAVAKAAKHDCQGGNCCGTC